MFWKKGILKWGRAWGYGELKCEDLVSFEDETALFDFSFTIVEKEISMIKS